MNERVFDTLVRYVAISRNRRSLLGLMLGAVLAGAIQPVGGEKDKKERKKKRKQEKKEQKRCERQVQHCATYTSNVCGTRYSHEHHTALACTVDAAGCCAHYRTWCGVKSIETFVNACLNEVSARYPGEAVH